MVEDILSRAEDSLLAQIASEEGEVDIPGDLDLPEGEFRVRLPSGVSITKIGKQYALVQKDSEGLKRFKHSSGVYKHMSDDFDCFAFLGVLAPRS